jgi:hypothetical protein
MRRAKGSPIIILSLRSLINSISVSFENFPQKKFVVKRLCMIMYEVIGYPNSCPSETFDVGLYKTRERAEQEMAKSYEDYSKCSFEIEEKWVEE